jgi:hypothetical protein
MPATLTEASNELIPSPDWRARHGVTPRVELEADRLGLPAVPEFEVVRRAQGYAWLRLARLRGLLPELPPI